MPGSFTLSGLYRRNDDGLKKMTIAVSATRVAATRLQLFGYIGDATSTVLPELHVKGVVQHDLRMIFARATNRSPDSIMPGSWLRDTVLGSMQRRFHRCCMLYDQI